MAYVLPSERIALDLDGPAVEVARITAWPIRATAAALTAAYFAARGEAAQLGALRELYRFVVFEAMPSWDIADHHGPIAPSAEGMLRLPLPLGLGIVMGWLETFDIEEKSSAVDELIPPGKAREELKRRLRAKAA